MSSRRQSLSTKLKFSSSVSLTFSRPEGTQNKADYCALTLQHDTDTLGKRGSVNTSSSVLPEPVATASFLGLHLI